MKNIKITKIINEKNEIKDLLLLADPSIKAIEEYINRGEVYVGLIDDIIVGTYILIKTRPFTMELVNIAVKEDYQGRGIGKALVNSAIIESKKQGAKALEVGTGNSSLDQLALYQKCGFRIIGVDRDFFKIHYKEKIMENGIECKDMIRLSMILD